MLEIIGTYYLQFFLGLTTLLMGILLKKIVLMLKENQAVKKGICAMQRNSLLKSCEDYLNRGWAPIEAKEAVNTLYQSYKFLGGDTFITAMVDQVNMLPNKPMKFQEKGVDSNVRKTKELD